jgi:hypothetical protein
MNVTDVQGDSEISEPQDLLFDRIGLYLVQQRILDTGIYGTDAAKIVWEKVRNLFGSDFRLDGKNVTSLFLGFLAGLSGSLEEGSPLGLLKKDGILPPQGEEAVRQRKEFVKSVQERMLKDRVDPDYITEARVMWGIGLGLRALVLQNVRLNPLRAGLGIGLVIGENTTEVVRVAGEIAEQLHSFQDHEKARFGQLNEGAQFGKARRDAEHQSWT